VSSRNLVSFAALLALVGCGHVVPRTLTPLPPSTGNQQAAVRVNGGVGAPEAIPPAQIAYGAAPPGRPGSANEGQLGGDVSLDFADTDIREVVAQILGNALHQNYTIDPAVKGTATFHTATPIPRSRLLATLQVLLSQNGATLVQLGGIYRVAPAAEATTAGVAGSDISAGSLVVPLKFASAEALAKLLTPLAGTAAKIGADPGRNALLISGEPGARASMVTLAETFDVDILAGQSYALLPVPSGDPKDFASAMQDAFRTQNGGALSGLVRVVPLERLASVLVVASQPSYIDAARRIFSLVEKARHFTERSWHVYYLQNSHADDVAYLLQQAFTPHNVTAQPSSATQGARGATAGASGGFGQGSGLGGGTGGGGTTSTGSGLGGGLTSGIGGGANGSTGGATLGGSGQPGQGGAAGDTGAPRGGATAAASTANANPLLGGLDSGGGGDTGDNSMRIIPNPQNNAVLVYATPQEESTVEAMLHKVDILPLQVRIDAVIAEVTLNDQLLYGTQFFFKGGTGFNTLLSGATTGGITAALFAGKGISEALAALQSVTTVDVLSSPELLVLDNETAQLQVGALVPYLSQTSQSTITTGSPVINSIQYQQTGVIMDVTPRVNSGGLVTLDIAQEVSDVNSSVTTAGINSPTFDERRVQSRLVVQDGQTVGLAGLIQDSQTKQNQGIPWLKDIPLLGLLAGQQNNNRSRTELLVLITPHVMHDQRDARALTEDLREQLPNAAGVPDALQRLPLSGSPDPNQGLRQKLRLEPAN
jgi:general secretion pathway protein D